MNCENPVLALKCCADKGDGKAWIKILPVHNRPDLNMRVLEERFGKDNILRLPCGRCTACKESYRADWSVRCDMEARYHNQNCFITLTYRPEVCPRWVSKGHVRRFIRDLRRSGVSCMYFSCGEYGSSGTERPHYHLILFGYFPEDAILKPEVKSKSGFETYESKFLNQLWNKGFVSVNNFSQDTAFYVAGYVNKKTGKYDGFLNMSNGIGYQYMMDHFDELYDCRYYIGRSGRVHRVPRAFKRICEKRGLGFKEREQDIINMRKIENSEMILRGVKYRDVLRGFLSNKMEDKLKKRMKRL